MATIFTPSISGSPEGKTNGFKLMRLIIDLGTEALRNEFKKIHPTGNLHTVFSSHQPTLNHLKVRNVITQPQWDKLYPPVPKIPNIKEFDITILVILLRNICGISAPIGTGWNKIPVNSDTSLGANIVRVKLFRNEFFGHIPETGVSTTEFEARWKEVNTTLVHLGISQADIDRLKDEECGEEEVERIRREWSENDTKVLSELRKMRAEHGEILLDIQNKVKPSFDNMNLGNYLDSCNFDADIESINEKWCKGTREWVFDEVSTWFDDTTSINRAFIIAGQAGMGKSVIAAVICKRFAKQLAACHFCQYNNDRYNNAKILLQSLATQLSNVIPEYRKALLEKLSGKGGERLDDNNIQGLFALLFKEPLTGVEVAERHLIVIDAVDESQHEHRNDLIDLIANYLWQLPSFIRFLITTRPENDIAKKFEKLKPIFLSRNNEQNRKDVTLYFQNKLIDPNLVDHIGKLLEKSDGLMLFADCIYQMWKDCPGKLDIDNLPSRIDEIYESYFKRLKSELDILKVTTNVFMSFLNVAAVAKQPLPIELLHRIFSLNYDSCAILRKVKNSLSSLLAVDEERISFFHKSVKDWLVESDHDFKVNEKLGHETLAEICAKEMDEIKMNGIKPPFQPAVEYALLYGIQHKLSGMQDKPLESFIDKYVIDLEIIYASISVDVDATLNNILSVKKGANYNTCSVPEQTHKNVEKLMSLIRKYNNILRDVPQSFLQHMLNWGESEISLNARSLLKSRYKDFAYFELMEKDVKEQALIGLIYPGDESVVWDFLPSENYVVCGTFHRAIELFSLADFKSLWTIKDVKLPFPHVAYYGFFLYHPLVFHPFKKVILPGRLDRVINLQGDFESGPFLCQDKNRFFNNCCFSSDCTKFVTIWEKQLTVWDLESNIELASLSADENLISISFSANDKLLASSEVNGKVVVYDVEKHFLRIKSNTYDDVVIFVCYFESDSWYAVWKKCFFKITCDLLVPRFVPSRNAHLPSNVKAVNEFKTLMENRQESWLNYFDAVQFFCLDNGLALVFDYRFSNAFRLFSISKLKEKPVFSFSPESYLEAAHMSVDGRFLYLKTTSSALIHKLDEFDWRITSSADHKRPLVRITPVTNGTIIIHEPNHEKCSHEAIPQLWNFDMTQCLDTFPQVSGIYKCESVSEQVIVCFKDEEVFFFNFVRKKRVSTTHFHKFTEVLAYGSKYHVVLREHCVNLSLWQNGKSFDEWRGILSQLKMPYDNKIIFSPSGDKLVILENFFFVFDVFSANFLRKIDPKSPYLVTSICNFLDEDHLLYCVQDELQFIVDVASGNTITCIYFHDVIFFHCISRKQDDGFVTLCNADRSGKKLTLMKVWLPR